MRTRAGLGSILLLAIAALAAVLPCAAFADTGLGRHKQLYAVPAPGKVAIDGKLDDWDLSGQVEMYVLSETKDMQSAKFAVMYDKDALYLSGVVRDPSPMMNRQDPKVRGNRGWDADACQVRLTLDPTQPYPSTESAWVHSGVGAVPDTRDDIVHMTLWYYTDRAEPCLNMQRGMTYRMVRPEWAPFGVVPSGLFQAKYVKAADGRGYTFEYRIPWSTLGAKKPLKASDVVAGTVQFDWGQPDGLQTAGGSAWCYDLLREPGFPYQSTACWGKIIFSSKGNVSRTLVDAGVPAEKPLPLKFAYDLPADGQITLQLVDRNRLVRRIIVAQGDRRAGHNVELWDGMDDHGKLLPAGNYTVEGIIHPPITEKFLFSAHNSGQPPYPTDDGKGGWGGDEGAPLACSAFPGGMLLSWGGAEYGWGIIRVDLDGHKQWGSRTSAQFMANDGKRYFVYDPGGFQAAAGIQVFDLGDGRPMNFGDGQPLLKAPPGGDKTKDAVTGLAYGAGKIYIAYGARGLIGVVDAASGRLLTTWNIPSPGPLAARPDGTVVGISNGSLVSLAGGAATVLDTADLDSPAGIAVGADGTIYVTNGGSRQDIAAFDSSGKLDRRIGKPGGRPAVGNYDPSGVYMPFGLAVDADGMLWVAESTDSPKRISVWNPISGAFVKEYFGASAYFGYAYINPAVPDEIYCHNVLWHVDWDTNTTTPIATIWRKTEPDMMGEPAPDAYPMPFRSITAANGKQYALGYGAFVTTTLYRRDGNLFKPFMATFNITRGWSLWQPLGIPLLDDPVKTPDGAYYWQDENGDQKVQANEVHPLPSPLGLRAMAPDMTIWTTGGMLLKPVKWLDNGQPDYDPTKPEKSFLTGTPNSDGYLWLDTDGGVYTLASGQLSRWNADGTFDWGYPGIPDWPSSLSLPVVKAGQLHGLTGGLGVAGDYTGNMTYFGPCHLFSREGIYTAAIMRDGRLGGLGADVGQPEGQGGDLVSVVTKPGAAPRTLILAGGQDGRVTEVLGLDTINPLPRSTFTLTPAQVKIASDAMTDYNLRTGHVGALTIASGRQSLGEGSGSSKALDDTRRFTARAAYDEHNLYVSFDVTSPSDLINAASNPKLLFKSGNCLDIQIATDPNADPARKTPALGDIRLLVTRQNGRPFAVMYRPKVAGFTGQPIVLVSPTGKEPFDDISVVGSVGLEYTKTGTGFKAVVAIPLDSIGLKLQKGQTVKMDIGVIYGNAAGTQTSARSYLFNNSFSANVTYDVPNESRLEPAEWGTASVE